MKRIISFLIAGLFALSFCACGQTTAAPERGTDVPPMLTAAPVQQPATSGEAGQEDAAPEAENELKAEAEKLIGKSVEKLLEALGEPTSLSYAPSCLGSGEDGEYIYDGFTVYTYKEGGTETVRSVE